MICEYLIQFLAEPMFTYDIGQNKAGIVLTSAFSI